MIYLFIGLAGAAGSLFRFWISTLFVYAGQDVFPWGTLVINLLGCFLLGCFTTYIANIGRLQPRLAAAIGTGFIGSFTTFSTFSTETVTMLRTGHISFALLYVVGSALGGLLFSLTGYKFGEWLQRQGAEIK